jgi:hypothetical protein
MNEQGRLFLIVNPDLFVAQLTLRQEIGWYQGSRMAGTLPRRTGRMCEDCIHGRHDRCGSPECACIHRQAAD